MFKNFKKNKYKKFYFVIIFIFFVFFFYFLKNRAVDKNIKKIIFIKNNVVVNVELATSPENYYLGLSNRKFLKQDWGMLFLFPNKEKRFFVMRDMNFSLDIVFIDENTIIDIYKNLPFAKKEQNILYNSSIAVDKVLELNGGFCDDHNVEVGDELKFLK